MRGLRKIKQVVRVLRKHATSTTFYQVREGTQTKWMSAEDLIQEERNQITFNQGILNGNTKRTIIAVHKD